MRQAVNSQSTLRRSLRWLVAGEVFLFAMAVPLALQPGPGFSAVGAGALYRTLLGGLLFGSVMVIAINALGLHVVRARSSLAHRVLKYVSSAIVAVGLLWCLLYLASQPEVPLSRISIAVATSFAAIALWRLGFHVLIESPVVRRNVLVMGAGAAAASFAEAFRRRSDRRGLDIIGFMPVSGDTDTGISPGRLFHSSMPLDRLCGRQRIDEIVVAADSVPAAALMDELLACRLQGVSVTQAPSFIEREFGRIPIELVRPDWWLDRDGFATSAVQAVLKRGFDLMAGLVLLVVASPLMLACALAIRLEEGWRAPVLFRQERTGLHGRPFLLMKFRSMRVDAESDGVARWATTDDKRVTRVGRFMRKVRLDELPQLINVLRGDMSLVGPRPERPQFVTLLSAEIPYYNWRHRVRPGITGWAQLCYPYGASIRDAREKLKYDLYYVKNQSLRFDLAILLRTVEVVLFGKGAR